MRRFAPPLSRAAHVHEPIPDSLRLPDIAEIRAAHERIARYVTRTPVINSPALDAVVGASLFLKCENLQRVGAFKARGACNAVLSLSDAAAKHGVVTHSSGNHGAAVAYAAQRRGIAAHVVMPENAARVKVANVEGFAGRCTSASPPFRRAKFCAMRCCGRLEARSCIPTTMPQ